jgi:hypothetical protein
MSLTIQVETTVLPGHRIEISSPELPEGRPATVYVIVAEDRMPKRRFLDVLAEYPGGQLFKTAEEVDAYVQAERSSWDS